MVSMLMRVLPYMQPNSSFWLRSTFSDTNIGTSFSPSRDIMGSYLVSGNLPGLATFSTVSGILIINNTVVPHKTYYYVAGNTQVLNCVLSLQSFGGGAWNEDNIVAFRI